MAKQNPKSRNPTNLDPEIYARLKAEAAAPFRGLRKFFYLAFAGSGFVGAFIFFTQILAGRDLEAVLPNLGLQIGVIALMIFLWRWDRERE